MTNSSGLGTQSDSAIPPGDLSRSLVASRSADQNLPHIGLLGDPYTILLTGKDTAGRFSLIDMHIPPGGGRALTATILRSPSSFSKVRSRLRFGE